MEEGVDLFLIIILSPTVNLKMDALTSALAINSLIAFSAGGECDLRLDIIKFSLATGLFTSSSSTESSGVSYLSTWIFFFTWNVLDRTLGDEL